MHLMVNWWKVDAAGMPQVQWPKTAMHGHCHVVSLCIGRSKACLPDEDFKFVSLEHRVNGIPDLQNDVKYC
jgi:hypothetical protein